MRPFLCVSLCCAILVSCQNASTNPATPLASAVLTAPTYSLRSSGDSLVAAFDVTVDAAAMSATATPIRGAQTQPPQGLTFDLDIDRFITSATFRIVGVAGDGAGNTRVTFSHAHPFRAPIVTNPPTAANRCDLGYTGRVIFLVKDHEQSFYANEVKLDPTVLIAPDGYIQTGDLLVTGDGDATRAYPYVLLADEAKDNREGIPNGGPFGTYDPAVSGWQRSNIGPAGTGWTGYDYVHGGQVVRNTFTLNGATLATGPVTLQAAILIKYTDPRGMGGPTLRIPPEPKKVLDFAYRLPYSAIDASVVSWSITPTIEVAQAATTPLSFKVRDWDAKAVEAADSTVGDETNVGLIQTGASGTPLAQFQCPALRANPITIAVVNNGATGAAGSELLYTGTLTNSLGSAAPGSYYGVVRLVDPEDGDPAATNYHFGVDAITLAGSAARALNVVTYQVIPVFVGQDPPPVVTQVLPTGIVGIQGQMVTFTGLSDNNPTSWSWQFGGGANPNISTDPAPLVALGAPGTYAGSVIATNAAGPSTSLPFSFTVGSATAKPVIQSVTPTGIIGCPRGGQITFSATILNGPTSYAWNFGTGTTPETSTDASPMVTLREQGTYNAVLVATNAKGDSAPFPFTYKVEGLWANSDVLNGPGSASNSLAFYGGRPVAATMYIDTTAHIATVRFLGSMQTIPTAGTDWNIHTVSTFAFTASQRYGRCSLINVNGRLMLFFVEQSRLRVAVSNTVEPILPAAAGDWTIHSLDESFESVIGALAFQGKPVVLANSGASARLYESALALPDGPEDWSFRVFITGVSQYGDQAPTLISYQPSGSAQPILAGVTGNRLTVDGHPSHFIGASSYGPETLGVSGNGSDPRLIVPAGTSRLHLATKPIPEAKEDYALIGQLSIESSSAQRIIGLPVGFAHDYINSSNGRKVAFSKIPLPVSLSDFDVDVSILSGSTFYFMDTQVSPSGNLMTIGGNSTNDFRAAYRACDYVAP